mmetsp:Transcript_43306/g.123456  ORF Transcript_43306/g.123456 Transcript_43306/m.123456 type:complete len:231 (+) Transcript_43306:196-888(+)
MARRGARGLWQVPPAEAPGFGTALVPPSSAPDAEPLRGSPLGLRQRSPALLLRGQGQHEHALRVAPARCIRGRTACTAALCRIEAPHVPHTEGQIAAGSTTGDLRSIAAGVEVLGILRPCYCAVPLPFRHNHAVRLGLKHDEIVASQWHRAAGGGVALDSLHVLRCLDDLIVILDDIGLGILRRPCRIRENYANGLVPATLLGGPQLEAASTVDAEVRPILRAFAEHRRC